MNYPTDLKYSQQDEWVRLEGKTATIGISDYAQDALSDIVFIEFLISEGDQVAKGDTLGTVESVKAASDVYFPIGGKVIEVNEALLEQPDLVNSEPYGQAWMVKIEVADSKEADAMMDAAAYQAFNEDRE
jgi:glycine cleavage system H protein